MSNHIDNLSRQWIRLPTIDKKTIEAIGILCVLFRFKGKFVTTEEILRETNIDVHDMYKVCNKIVKSGFLLSKIGKNGGYCLKCDLSIKDVIESLDNLVLVKNTSINSRILTLFNRMTKVKLSDLIDEE